VRLSELLQFDDLARLGPRRARRPFMHDAL
jgi:hypothetical protein